MLGIRLKTKNNNKMMLHSCLKDNISSPISPQIFYFCDPDLFSDGLQNSEDTSSSNCRYEENSYASNLQVPPDLDKLPNTPTGTGATTSTNNSNLSIIFDSPDRFDNEISASIDFSFVPNLLQNQNNAQLDQFDFSQIQFSSDVFDYPAADPVSVSLMGHNQLTSVFEDNCLSSVPTYAHFNPLSPSYNFLGPAIGSSYMPTAGTINAAALSADMSGLFGGGILLGSDFQTQELDYQGDKAGNFCPDSLQRVFNPGDLQLQGLGSSEIGGTGNTTPLASEISNLDDSVLKVVKLSVEQRKEKIHRYMKKRNQRNFSKKIKYACRKTLADSRPRVRGRFAKNDDFGEANPMPSCSNHEEDTDDEVVVKEEEELVYSSDIFAHISGVNSFKCNYPIQSWI